MSRAPHASRVVGIGAACALALSLVLSGCGGASTPSGSSDGDFVEGGTFTTALSADPGNLDPSMTPSSVARSVLAMAYDTLVYQTDQGEFVSGLAEEWEADARSASFTLKKDITCSDGSPLTATDVADNISYLADPKNKSPLTGVTVQAGVTAKADDAARTIKVTSPADNGFLLAELSGLFVICRAGLDDHDALASKTIGTGPWQLKEAVADDHYLFEPAEGYAWGPDGATLDGPGVPAKINFRILPNASTTANLVLSGEVNFATVSGPDAGRLKDLKTIDSITTSGETWFNQSKGHPGADRAVREALTVGTNMAELSKVATGGTGQPSTGFITIQPTPCVGNDTVKGNLPAFDQEKAKSILEEAGWKAGPSGVREKDGQPLKINFRYDTFGLSSRTAGAEYLAKQWKEIGVDVNLQSLPEAQLNELFFSTGAWDVAWAAFTFNLPSQMPAFVSGPTIPDGANFSSIVNEDYSKLVEKAGPLVGADSCDAWGKAEAALLKDFNLIPMFDDVTHTYLKNVELTAPGGQVWGTSIRLKKG